MRGHWMNSRQGALMAGEGASGLLVSGWQPRHRPAAMPFDVDHRGRGDGECLGQCGGAHGGLQHGVGAALGEFVGAEVYDAVAGGRAVGLHGGDGGLCVGTITQGALGLAPLGDRGF